MYQRGKEAICMKHQILAVGLKDDLLSHCREHFIDRNIELKNIRNISEAVHILEKEAAQMLVLDMEYLRSIGQSNRIVNIRYVSFIPIVVLSDIQEKDAASTINAGADACYDNKLSPSAIALLLSAQLRRYTEYNHFLKPETAPFQVGDIAIDPARRQVWVQGKLVSLLPREFSLLLYFMRNPGIVLTHEQICEHAWKKDYIQDIAPAIHNLRKKIEKNPASPVYIKTEHRAGYRFTGHYSCECPID